MRKKKNDETLQQVFERMFSDPRVRDKYRQAMLSSVWKSEMGDFISSRTTSLQYAAGVVTITVSSSPLKHEILQSKAQIIYRLNKKAGHDIVRDLKVF